MVGIERKRQILADAYVDNQTLILVSVKKRLVRFGIGGPNEAVLADRTVEVIQAAFEVLFREDKVAEYYSGASPLARILKFCEFQAKALGSRLKREGSRQVDHLQGEMAGAAPDEAFDTLVGRDTGEHLADIRADVEELLSTASPKEQELLRLFYLEGIPLVALSERLGEPVGTLNSRLSRARRKLRAG